MPFAAKIDCAITRVRSHFHFPPESKVHFPYLTTQTSHFAPRPLSTCQVPISRTSKIALFLCQFSQPSNGMCHQHVHFHPLVPFNDGTPKHDQD